MRPRLLEGYRQGSVCTLFTRLAKLSDEIVNGIDPCRTFHHLLHEISGAELQ